MGRTVTEAFSHSDGGCSADSADIDAHRHNGRLQLAGRVWQVQIFRNVFIASLKALTWLAGLLSSIHIVLPNWGKKPLEHKKPFT